VTYFFITSLSASRCHAVGHGCYQRFNAIDFAVDNLEQLGDEKRKRLIERRIHFMFRAVGRSDGLVLAGMIETDNR
jgi:hypothetical protein